MILLHLDRNEILVLQRLNQTCLGEVAQSTAIRKRLFLEDGAAAENADFIGRTCMCGLYDWDPCRRCTTAWNHIRRLPDFEVSKTQPFDDSTARDTERHFRFKYISTEAARAVLARDRTKFSWEAMFSDSDLLTRIVLRVEYLKTITVDMGEGSGDSEWLAEEIRTLIINNPARKLRLGALCRLAALEVVQDSNAWQKRMTEKETCFNRRSCSHYLQQNPLSYFQDVEVNESTELEMQPVLPANEIQRSTGEGYMLHALCKVKPDSESTAEQIRDVIESWVEAPTTRFVKVEADSLTGRYRVAAWAPSYEKAEQSRKARAVMPDPNPWIGPYLMEDQACV